MKKRINAREKSMDMLMIFQKTKRLDRERRYLLVITLILLKCNVKSSRG